MTALIGCRICLRLAKNAEQQYLLLNRSSLAPGVRMRKGGYHGEKAGDWPCLRMSQVVTLLPGSGEAVSLGVAAEMAESGLSQGMPVQTGEGALSTCLGNGPL